MSMNFEELDDKTRQFMLIEFEAEEQSGNPFRGKRLSAVGILEFPNLMRHAIRLGNEQTLIVSLLNESYWKTTETYKQKGSRNPRHIDLQSAARNLGLTEFNTWYIRGFAKRLLEEGNNLCQVYRAASPQWEESMECKVHEDKIFSVQDIYNGHRARYWPEPGNRAILSIPPNPNCHHTIRRV